MYFLQVPYPYVLVNHHDETALLVRVFFVLSTEEILHQLVDDFSHYNPII